MTTLPFDAALVRERRLTLGISQRVLARSIGVSFSTLGLVENGNDAVRHLSLAQAARLADALSVPLARLLTSPDEEPAPSPATTSSDATLDGAMLGEVLHAARSRNAEISDVRQALGWDRTRYDAAQAALSASLVGTGQHLHRIPGYVGLLPGNVGPESVERFRRLEAARIGMKRREAKLIRETALGLISRARLHGFAATTALPPKAQGLAARLRSGLLVNRTDGSTGLVLSQDLRYCFALDEVPLT